MADKVSERPLLPSPTNYALSGIFTWGGQLIRQLIFNFQTYGYRLNRVLPKDGSEAMEGPLELESYEEADLPDAADHEGAIVYVSDGASGSKFRGSDGTDWVDLG